MTKEERAALNEEIVELILELRRIRREKKEKREQTNVPVVDGQSIGVILSPNQEFKKTFEL